MKTNFISLASRLSFTFLLVSTIFVAATPHVFAANALGGYWKFDETISGSPVLDSSGNNNTGTILGDTPTPTVSYPSLKNTSDTESLNFDGNTSVSVTSATSVNLTGSFTIAFWINPSSWNDSASRGIISKYDSDTSKGFIIYDDGSNSCGGACGPLMNLRIHGQDGVAEYIYSTSAVDVGTWQYWAVVYDADAQTAKWYKNGVLDSTYTDVVLGDASNSVPLTLGLSQPWSGYFNGNLDEVRLYQNALSSDDIASLSALSVVGYESSDTVVTPDLPGTAHNPANAGSQDGMYWTTAISTSTSGYDTQVYKFSPDLTGMTNPKFSVNWFGHGAVPDDKNVFVSIWNSLSSAWEQLASNHCSTDCTL